MDKRQEQKELFPFLQAIIDEKNTKDLIDIASAVYNNPVLLTNASFKTLAMAGDDINDRVWQDARDFGCCSDETVVLFRKDKAAEKLFSSDTSFFYTTGLGKHIPRILKRISIKHKTIGYFIVFGKRTLSEEQLQLTDNICRILSLQLLHDFKIEELSDSIPENIIYDLLQKNPGGILSLQERLKSAKWTLLPLFCCIVTGVKEDSLSSFYTDYLKEKIDRAAINSHSVIFNNAVVIIINGKDSVSCDKEVQRILNITENMGIQLGKSRYFNRIEQIYDSYRQASKALRIGKYLKKPYHIIPFEDCDLYSIFEKLEREDLEDLIHPGFLKLQEYDRLHNTIYTETLISYMEEGCSVSQAAQVLNIHRNTMTYRINKIEEILEYTISEGKENIKMYISQQIAIWRSLIGWNK